MKSLKTIQKNLKLLFRSKGSALVILLAPLIIVLVIAVSFSDTPDTSLNIGAYAPDSGELTQRFITNLNSTGNNVIMFKNDSECIQAIKETVVLACVVFPNNFVLENQKENEVLFYVDKSRENLVHRMIASLSVNVDVESSQVSKEITTQLLNILSETSTGIDASLDKIIGLKAKTQSASGVKSASEQKLTGLDTSGVNVDIDSILENAEALQSDFSSLRANSRSAVTTGFAVITKHAPENISSDKEWEDFQEDLTGLDSSVNRTNTSSSEFDILVEDVESAKEGVDALKAKLTKASETKTAVITDLQTLSSNLQNIATDLDAIKQKQELLKTNIASFKLTDADSIVNPVKITVEPVSSEQSKIAFSFPYLLMLIVLYVGLMLASTLVFIEKDSRALFRTFTLPVRGSFFIFQTYLTSLIVIIIQTFIALFAVQFALNITVFTNFGVTAVFLFLSISLFIILGMLIGHLFSTSEGMTMTTITIGAVLMFLSNLVLPLETLSELIQQIARFNPYVIASEGIRKAVLFNATFQTTYVDMIILFAYCLVAMLVTLLVKNVTSSRYLKNIAHRAGNKGKITVPEDHYLVLKGKYTTVKNITDLIECLKELSDEEYKKIVKEKNIFSEWLSQSLKARFLAIKIMKKDRKRVIEILEKYIEKKS